MKRDRVYMGFSCDPAVAKWIKQTAEQKRSTPSQIIREMLFNSYNKEQQKPDKKKQRQREYREKSCRQAMRARREGAKAPLVKDNEL